MQVLRKAVAPFLLNGAPLAKPVVDGFHRIYYSSETWRRNTFLGYPIMQCPLDMHLYQELIFSLRPDVIIQTGVASGGSLLYLASMLDIANVPNTRVIGIDIKLTEKARTLTHPRISMI